MAQSKAIRDRKNRKDKTIRGKEVFGGVQIRATKQCTGRLEVDITTVPVTNPQRADYAMGVDR